MIKLLCTVERHSPDPNKFLPVDEMKLLNVGCPICHALTAGYNGTNNAANLVIVGEIRRNE